MARHQQFGGFGGGANMQQLMRQAQKLQEQMTKAQEDIEAREFSAQVGGGLHTAEETRQSELGKLAPGMGGMF